MCSLVVALCEYSLRGKHRNSIASLLQLLHTLFTAFLEKTLGALQTCLYTSEGYFYQKCAMYVFNQIFGTFITLRKLKYDKP